MNVFLLYVFRQENKLDLIANAFIIPIYIIYDESLSEKYGCKGTTIILYNKMFFNLS